MKLIEVKYWIKNFGKFGNVFKLNDIIIVMSVDVGMYLVCSVVRIFIIVFFWERYWGISYCLERMLYNRGD